MIFQSQFHVFFFLFGLRKKIIQSSLAFPHLYCITCISKAFDKVWHAGLLHKLRSYGISGQIFGLIFSFLSNKRLRVVLDGKSSQEYPVNAGVPQGSILGPKLFLLYIMTFLMMLSVLLSMHAMLLGTLCSNVIRHLICRSYGISGSIIECWSSSRVHSWS